MSLGGLSLVLVYARYVDMTGAPGTGTVAFTPGAWIADYADDQILVPTVITGTLDGTGYFSVMLPATDDPNLSWSGATYTVTVTVNNQHQSYAMTVPIAFAGTGIDLLTVTPVAATAPSTQVPAGYSDPYSYALLDLGV